MAFKIQMDQLIFQKSTQAEMHSKHRETLQQLLSLDSNNNNNNSNFLIISLIIKTSQQ